METFVDLGLHFTAIWRTKRSAGEPCIFSNIQNEPDQMNFYTQRVAQCSFDQVRSEYWKKKIPIFFLSSLKTRMNLNGSMFTV